jgi:hypothetical protein
MEARKYYGKDLGNLVDFYLDFGFVYSDHELFLLAMPYQKSILELPEQKMLEKELDNLDCWYVHYASGNLKKIFKVSPFDLEWVAFERGEDEIKFYKMDRIRRASNAF